MVMLLVFCSGWAGWGVGEKPERVVMVITELAAVAIFNLGAERFLLRAALSAAFIISIGRVMLVANMSSITKNVAPRRFFIRV